MSRSTASHPGPIEGARPSGDEGEAGRGGGDGDVAAAAPAGNSGMAMTSPRARLSLSPANSLNGEGEQNWRTKVHRFLDEPRSGPGAYVFAIVMLIIILLSVVILCLQVRTEEI